MSYDLHAHLYGYLTWQEVHQLGASRWQERQDRLHWYATAYQQAWKRKPCWEKYWKQGGEALLQEDFEMSQNGSFQQFQACFNLMIALLPAVSDAATVARTVLQRLRTEGVLKHVEMRMLLPPESSQESAYCYLDDLLREFAEASTSNFSATLAVSLPRDQRFLWQQYAWLKSWQKNASSELNKCFTAIDFCGEEEPWPPFEMKRFLQRVHDDNQKEPRHALAILSHVGETCVTLTPQSAIRRVAQTAALGVHRLGHATVLGVPAQNLTSFQESVRERRMHLLWLLQEHVTLERYGYRVDCTQRRKELQQLAAHQGVWTCGDDPVHRVADVKNLQNTVMSWLSEMQSVVECCPTSNLRLGPLQDLRDHPLPRFLNADMRVCLGSDDPGIFVTTLEDEYKSFEQVGVSADKLQELRYAAPNFLSSRLVNR